MPRLGVIGTLVWDRIWRRETILEGARPVEDWGGIAYSLAAVAAAMGDGWEGVPLVKVGRDLEAAAGALIGSLPGLRGDLGLHVVDEPNNRVELRYTTDSARTERLTGGVPAWRWSELEPVVADLDALFVNFISGYEMDLEDVEALRAGFDGPIYSDLHSLFLDRLPDGTRVPRPLPEWERWVACFDGIQLNESELGLLATGRDDPIGFVRAELPSMVGLVVVTLGSGGSAIFFDPARAAHPFPAVTDGAGRVGSRFRELRVPPPGGASPGDPTGCGDVWGGAFIASAVQGRSVEASARRASIAATAKMAESGTSGLYLRLRDAMRGDGVDRGG